ncbi:MAG: NAD(P)H-hydrate dehydratase [Planctomycetota bacterium]
MPGTEPRPTVPRHPDPDRILKNLKPPTMTADVPRLPPRPAAMHKGQSGRVAVIAGSRGMSGAAVLCGLGALRGGAGLVRVYCPGSIQPVIATHEPSLMTVGLPETKAGQISDTTPMELITEMMCDWAGAIAIGPGLGPTKPGDDIFQIVGWVLADTHCPVVADADALNAAPDEPPGEWLGRRRDIPTIITPHPGEMARLRKVAGLPPMDLPSMDTLNAVGSNDAATGEYDQVRLRIAHEYAALTGVTVVLKGYRTVVCTAEQAYINTTGNPGMATGGMGDVLTGLIAALLGQGLPPFDAARLAVYTHGLAGDYCVRKLAPAGFVARELAEELPRALADAARAPIGFR